MYCGIKNITLSVNQYFFNNPTQLNNPSLHECIAVSQISPYQSTTAKLITVKVANLSLLKCIVASPHQSASTSLIALIARSGNSIYTNQIKLIQ